MFLFFGVVAVTGTYYAQIEALEWEAFVLAVPVGLLASAILVVNNIRDLETDRRAGKRTLAVRLGRARARVLYVAMVAGAFVTAPVPWLLGLAVGLAAAGLLAVPLAVPSSGSCGPAPTGRRSTARWPTPGSLQLAFCLLLATGVLASCCGIDLEVAVGAPPARAGRCGCARRSVTAHGITPRRRLLAVRLVGADGARSVGG